MAYTIKVHNCSHTTWGVPRDPWVEFHSHMCDAGIRREEHGKRKVKHYCTCSLYDITDQYNRVVGLRECVELILTIPPPHGERMGQHLRQFCLFEIRSDRRSVRGC